MQIQTVNISLPRELVKEADRVAQMEYKTRSELIKSLLASYVRSMAAWDHLFAYGKRIGRKMGIKSEEDVYKIVDDYRHVR